MQPLKHIQLHPPKHTHTSSSHTNWTYLSLWFWSSSAEMLQAVFLAFCSAFLRHTVSWTRSAYVSIQRINILDLILCSRSSPIKATWFMFCQLFTHAGHIMRPAVDQCIDFWTDVLWSVTVQDCPVNRTTAELTEVGSKAFAGSERIQRAAYFLVIAGFWQWPFEPLFPDHKIQYRVLAWRIHAEFMF